MNKKLKALSIGNSFSVDTMEHLAAIARSFGYTDITLGNLYIGGCSIAIHHSNFKDNIGAYKFYENAGNEWSETSNFKISDAIKKENWDFISIQHGSKNGSRYSNPSSYECLPELVKMVRELAPKDTKILFNLAWVAEPESNRQEITEWGGQKKVLFNKMCDITSNLIEKESVVDFVCPTGTAIMNACETHIRDRLYRDGFHLSYDLGRFIAALTFFARLTGEDTRNATVCIDDISDADLEIAIASVENAINNPYKITF